MVQFNRFIINIAIGLVSVNAITHLLNNLPLDMLPTGGLPFDSLPLDSLSLDGGPLSSLPLTGHGNSGGCLGFLGGVGSMLGVDRLLGCESSEEPEHHHHTNHRDSNRHHHRHRRPDKSEEDHIRENIDFTLHENISEDELSR